MSSGPVLRSFTLEDVPALVEVAMATYPLDPQWLYRFPRHDEDPFASAAIIKARMEHTITVNQASGASTGTLLEVPREDGSGEKEVVGFGIWRNPGFHVHKEGGSNFHPHNPPLPPSADPIFTAHFYTSLHTAFAPILAQYGDAQLELSLLYVSPSHQGKGYARRIIQWGLDRAKKEGVVVTLAASPMGRGVYEKMGFRQVGEMKAEDRERGLGMGLCGYPIMVWDGNSGGEGGGV